MKLWPLESEINEFRNFVEKSDEKFKENEGFFLFRISTPTLDAFC